MKKYLFILSVLELVFRGKVLHIHALCDMPRCLKGIGRELSIKTQKYCVNVGPTFILVDRLARNIAWLSTDFE